VVVGVDGAAMRRIGGEARAGYSSEESPVREGERGRGKVSAAILTTTLSSGVGRSSRRDSTAADRGSGRQLGTGATQRSEKSEGQWRRV